MGLFTDRREDNRYCIEVSPVGQRDGLASKGDSPPVWWFLELPLWKREMTLFSDLHGSVVWTNIHIHTRNKINNSKTGMVVHTFKPSTWEAEAGGSLSVCLFLRQGSLGIPGCPGAHIELSWLCLLSVHHHIQLWRLFKGMSAMETLWSSYKCFKNWLKILLLNVVAHAFNPVFGRQKQGDLWVWR